MAIDRFAEIAANERISRMEELCENPPMEIRHTECCLTDDLSDSMVIPHKPYTKEELRCSLKEMRNCYAPYLRDCAPAVEKCTESIDIREFVLDGDRKITVPYYGGPTGNARQIYDSRFYLENIPLDKAFYVCLDGADYIAFVYINGECVGVHEGFFSPFSFEITDNVRPGYNDIRIILKNDYIYMGNDPVPGETERICGDKLYAATGLGYDDPLVGWHHCPPGMGLYNNVRIEIRNRMSITDLYVRSLPDSGKAELWVEVENADYSRKVPEFYISLYGQNFDKVLFENMKYIPYFDFEKESDSVKVQLNAGERNSNMPAAHGRNIYKIMLDMADFRFWEPDSPWLYQIQVRLMFNGDLCDAKKQQFGMRSFIQDKDSSPKGMFYLNGRKVRLRGANTMGYEQQDVLSGDFDKLIDDILLSKLCNMNFLRLTQRPVQDEVYEYCDKLGMMTQTDLPLFACMRRTKYAEGVRQTEEMIKMVRKHPCNIIVSYINEPSANAFEQPHRNLMRDELERFFESCDNIVRLNCPECVTKHVDGDYDPPTADSMPDNHCYNLWYNGHAIDFGRLYRGYWKETAKDWYFGCGEYGAEGLDYADVMKKYYPSDWLREPFNPKNIIRAQSEAFHGYFFDTPGSMDEWIEATQAHQAFSAKMLTECFRRNPKMISTAIHLFIDAWPAGWMKSIMDCERNPKPAYFACRDAFSPVLISLRSDRFTYWSGEKIKIETYVSNDIDRILNDCRVLYELYKNGKKIKSASLGADIKNCDVTYVADASFTATCSGKRESFVLKAILTDASGAVVSSNSFNFEVFAPVDAKECDDVIFVCDLECGEHIIAGERVVVSDCEMGGRHFVSCATGHEAVKEFDKNDFRYWYSRKDDCITPIVHKTFTAEGFEPVLSCINKTMQCVVAEKLYEGKRYVISTLDMRLENPVAFCFRNALIDYHLDTRGSASMCRKG